MRHSIEIFQVEVLGGFEDEEEEDGEAFGMEGMEEANHGDENNIMAVQGEIRTMTNKVLMGNH